MELDQLLEQGLEQTGRVVAGVKPEQYSAPTPCAEWDVRAVLDHIIGGNHFFAAAASGQSLPPGEVPDPLGDDPAGAYAQGAKAALEAWRQPGAAERTITLPIGDVPGAFGMGLHFVDHVVHAWDIAKATGQEGILDVGLAAAAYGLVNGNIGDDLRQAGGPFGPEVPCDENASAIERLVAYLGRTP